MEQYIAENRLATDDEWDKIWSRCEYATYFQSREWAEVWQNYTGGTSGSAARFIKFSDNIEAILPLSWQISGKGWIRTSLFSPGGHAGGWISEADLSSSPHAELLVRTIAALGDVVWRVNPYQPIPKFPPLFEVTMETTSVLRLKVGFEEIYKNWSSGHIRSVKRARTHQVAVRLAQSEEDWRHYFGVYQDSLRRWGKKVTVRYDWRLFSELCRRSSRHIRLWLACYQGEIIAGVICLYSRTIAVYWHGAALEAHFAVCPVHLLMYEAIKDACEHGYSVFDFNPSGVLVGVEAFKKRFGAIPLASPVITRTTWTTRSVRHLRNLLVRYPNYTSKWC